MKNIVAIIFDMDGTIVQTESIWKEASDIILSKSPLNLTPQTLQEFHSQAHGLAMKETCTLIKEYGKFVQPVEEIMNEKKRLAKELYAKGITFVPGFPEFHQKISHLKTGVATNADQYTLDTTARVMNLSQFFGAHLYSIASVDNRCKPLPDIYLYAAQKLQVSPHQCLAIEDSAHGIAAAKAAGMLCIGINTSGDIDQLKHADYIIHSYDTVDLSLLGK